MPPSSSFLDFLQRDKPEIWRLLQYAQAQGLIVIDEPSDSINASNHLLLTYPGLHTVLTHLNNNWAEEHVSLERHMHALLAPPKEAT